MNLQEIAWGHLDWMDLAQDRGMLCAVVNVVLLSPTYLDAQSVGSSNDETPNSRFHTYC